MRIAASLALGTSLLLTSGAGADLCQFGYADAAVIGDGVPLLSWTGAQNAGVPQDSGRIIPVDGTSTAAHTRNIRPYIQAMNASGIRPFVDLTDVVFKSNPVVNPNCGAQYERGHLRANQALGRQGFKPSYTAKLDSFLARNASELGTSSIRGFIIHVEVNNNCVPPWRISAVAQELEARGYGTATGYDLAAGYGLTYALLPAGPVSTGMPTGLFPAGLSHITPWAYDVHSLRVDHQQRDSIYNLNADVLQLGATGFWNKLVSKLRAGQQVIWGMTALCGELQEQMFNGPHLPPHNQLGMECTTSIPSTWPLASVADEWRWFAEAQPRMDGLIAIHWDAAPGAGTARLHQVVTDSHVLIGNSAMTCE